MPSVFGKDSKKKELIANLGEIYHKIEKEHQISPGDFPNLAKMQVRFEKKIYIYICWLLQTANYLFEKLENFKAKVQSGMTFQPLLSSHLCPSFLPLPSRMGLDGDEIYFSWFARKSCFVYATPIGSHWRLIYFYHQFLFSLNLLIPSGAAEWPRLL